MKPPEKNYFMSGKLICPSCAELGHPMIGDDFIFFKSDASIIAIKHFKGAHDGGYSHHIIQYSEPLHIKDGLVRVHITCSRNGCGLQANAEAMFLEGVNCVPIKFLHVDEFYIAYEEFKMHRQNWLFLNEHQI